MKKVKGKIVVVGKK